VDFLTRWEPIVYVFKKQVWRREELSTKGKKTLSIRRKEIYPKDYTSKTSLNGVLLQQPGGIGVANLIAGKPFPAKNELAAADIARGGGG